MFVVEFFPLLSTMWEAVLLVAPVPLWKLRVPFRMPLFWASRVVASPMVFTPLFSDDLLFFAGRMAPFGPDYECWSALRLCYPSPLLPPCPACPGLG